MKISTKARYGARAMVDLALAYPDRAVPVKELARNERISEKYLEQIMAALKASGLTKAARGMRGGYALSRPPSSISLNDVFKALEGAPELVECLDDPNGCPLQESCPTRATWMQMRNAIVAVLDGTTLEELADRKKAKGGTCVPMYNI